MYNVIIQRIEPPIADKIWAPKKSSILTSEVSSWFQERNYTSLEQTKLKYPLWFQGDHIWVFHMYTI